MKYISLLLAAQLTLYRVKLREFYSAKCNRSSHVELLKLSKGMSIKTNEQTCRLVVLVPLQTFRGWPFISGVTIKYVGNVAKFA